MEAENLYLEGYAVGKRVGISEMIEWIQEKDCGDKSCVVIPVDDWDIKLKEVNG